LFNVFIDDLSIALTKTGIGCCISSIFVNHLFYADDSVLLAPSPYALQTLFKGCEKFAANNDILYNVKKTVSLCIRPKQFKSLTVPNVRLYNKDLKWVDECKYLGIFLTSNCSDIRDIRRQLRSLYARGNVLIRKFGKCSLPVKLQLFKSYLSNMYCIHLWNNYRQSDINRIKVAYNNVYRKLMAVNTICSISGQYVQNNVDSFQVIRRKSITSFRNRLFNCDNSFVGAIITTTHFIHSSRLQLTWQNLVF